MLEFLQTSDGRRMDAHYGPVENTSLKVLLNFGSDPSDLAMRAAVFICDLYNYKVS